MTKRSVLESLSTENLRKTYTESGITSSSPQEELLRQLDQFGVEWYITDEGTLRIKYWQIGAENFAPFEQIAELRKGGHILTEADAMEWVSRHLDKLRAQYAGNWIAVVDNEVVAASSDFSDLLAQMEARRIEKPFITQIPAQQIVWDTAYAH